MGSCLRLEISSARLLVSEQLVGVFGRPFERGEIGMRNGKRSISGGLCNHRRRERCDAKLQREGGGEGRIVARDVGMAGIAIVCIHHHEQTKLLIFTAGSTMLYPCPVAGLYIRTQKYPEAVGMLLRFAAACDSTGAQVSQCKAYLGAVVVWLFASDGAQAWAVYQVRNSLHAPVKTSCLLRRCSSGDVRPRCIASLAISCTRFWEHTHIKVQCHGGMEG